METTSTTTQASATVSTTETTQEKVLVLKLRNKVKTRVKWTQDTINNEYMNKKSSKLCCIYHKPKKFGESDSDESDSDNSGSDDGKARPTHRSGKHNVKKIANMTRFHA